MATQGNLVSQINDFLIAQLNATGTGRFSQTVFMIGSMQINKSFKCVLLSAKIKPFLQSGKPQNTRSNQGFLLHNFFTIPILYSYWLSALEDHRHIGCVMCWQAASTTHTCNGFVQLCQPLRSRKMWTLQNRALIGL